MSKSVDTAVRQSADRPGSQRRDLHRSHTSRSAGIRHQKYKVTIPAIIAQNSSAISTVKTAFRIEEAYRDARSRCWPTVPGQLRDANAATVTAIIWLP
jgi:hypothetical protein